MLLCLHTAMDMSDAPARVTYIRERSHRAFWFSVPSGSNPSLPSVIYSKKTYLWYPCPFPNYPTYFAQSAPRRGGRNRTATDKNKLPGGRSKRNDAYCKEKERHWAGWSKKDRDAKMAETAPLRDAACEEFEAEQMEMEDEWLVRGSFSPAPIATQVIVLC